MFYFKYEEMFYVIFFLYVFEFEFKILKMLL